LSSFANHSHSVIYAHVITAWGVRLAKYLRTHVTGICSERNRAWLQSELGTDLELDYNMDIAEQWRVAGIPAYDLVFDCVGGDEYWQLVKPLMKPGCRYVTAVGPYKHGDVMTIGKVVGLLWALLVRNLAWANQSSYSMTLVLPNAPWALLNEWVSAQGPGALKPVPTQTILPLAQGKEGIKLLESHRSRGKIVLIPPPVDAPSSS
jgi:NADPH:quinone reductase-like Zn-dependent oxidoreductase